MDRPLRGVTKERTAILLRQWVRADIVRIEYTNSQTEDLKLKDLPEAERMDRWMMTTEATFLFLWISLLFSIIEGMNEGGVDVLSTFAIDENYYKRFKRFRDANFHIGSSFWDARFHEFLELDLAVKTKEIHFKIGPMIKSELESRVQEGRVRSRSMSQEPSNMKK